jgi:polygalacturonase
VLGSASWSTHIFRSRLVVISGVKIFSGADGFDPDNSQHVSIDSAFVHSNDDAVAVKATMPAPAMNTERIVVTRGVFSTKKSCLKVGTESLRDFSDVLFR